MAVLGALFAGAVILGIAVNPSFEYDEAVYATMARASASGTPDTGASLVRAPGLPLAGSVVARFSEREAAFRAVGLLSGLGLLAVAWTLARALGGSLAALVAVGALITSPELQLRSSQFLTDVPAVALLTAVMTLLWRELEGTTGPGPRLLAVAPLTAAAFYLRYASVVPLGAIGITAAVLWGRRLRGTWRWPAATAALLAVLLGPHLFEAVRSCGAPWGILKLSSTWAGQYREGVGHGLGEYARWIPYRLAGPVAGALMLIALARLMWLSGARRSRRRSCGASAGAAADCQGGQARLLGARGLAFLVVPAVIHLFVLGMTNRGEARFALFSATLLTTAGAAVVAGPLRRVHPAPAVLGVSVIVVAFIIASRSTVETNRRQAEARAVLADAGRAIRGARQAGQPCSVISVGVPILTWYSGCTTSPFSEPTPAGARPSFVVVVDKFRLTVPRRVVVPYLRSVNPTPVAILASGPRRIGEATVYRVTAKVPGTSPVRTGSLRHSCTLPPRRF